MIERMDLVGSVQGKDCIIVDDMIDTAVSGLSDSSRVLSVKQVQNSKLKGLKMCMLLQLMDCSLDQQVTGLQSLN